MCVYLEGDRIAGLSASPDDLPEADECYDAGGRMVMPGFIDIHFHGAVGYDVTDGSTEGIAAIADAKLKEGATTICPATLTLPENSLAPALETVAEYMSAGTGAKVAGVHLEGPFINPDCTGAQNPDHVRAPDIEEIRRLQKICPVAIVSFAPEMLDAKGHGFIEQLVDEGICPSCGHTAAEYDDVKAAMASGLRSLTHFCNQMSKLHHREIGCVGAGLLEDDLNVEIICDTIHLCPDMISLVFRHKPLNRITLITDAMRASGLEDGEYDLGGLAVKVADNAARLVSNGALAGSVLTMNEALKNVHSVTGIPLSDLVTTTSLNQASLLGLEKLGRIEQGWQADLTVLNDDFSVETVFVDGHKKL